LAREFGGSHSRVDLACSYGKPFWRVCWAGTFGWSNWHIYTIDIKQGKHAVEPKKGIKCIMVNL
jgi:hypothetical protein